MRGVLGLGGLLLICLLSLGCNDGGGRRYSGGTGGVDAGAGGQGGNGAAGGQGGEAGNGGLGGAVPSVCQPGTSRNCYTGPPGTVNVGICAAGTETCNGDGTAFGACENEVVPSMEVPTPPGGTPADEDCDGMTDENQS